MITTPSCHVTSVISTGCAPQLLMIRNQEHSFGVYAWDLWPLGLSTPTIAFVRSEISTLPMTM